MTFIASEAGSVFRIDPVKARTTGLDLRQRHLAGDPFPHSVIDDFLPSDVLRLCQDRFPARAEQGCNSFDRAQERKKTEFSPDYLDDELRLVFMALTSRSMLQIIENITGINGLMPDPYFTGGGFHETRTGGHLGVHVDFNHHEKLDLERRVNMIIYLNDDWTEADGGQLELWDRGMTRAVQSVVPIANRAVIFSTSDHSFHGHTQPVAEPNGRPRRSIALYYYTATWDETRKAKTTVFRARPGSEDRVDWRVKSQHILSDVVPPVLYRSAAKITRRLSS